MFQSPLGEVVKETIFSEVLGYVAPGGFQSPLGEVVKETFWCLRSRNASASVSIPSRGSGKGDSWWCSSSSVVLALAKFQSPLGEVVKETTESKNRFSI